MKTLDEALLLLLQRITRRSSSSTRWRSSEDQPAASATCMNIRRHASDRCGENLQGQFGMIADQVMAVNLATSRGASEKVRVRTLREGVAQIRQALEIAIAQTKDKHAVKDRSRRRRDRADAASKARA